MGWNRSSRDQSVDGECVEYAVSYWSINYWNTVFKDFRRISQNLINIPVEDLKYRSNNLRLQTDSLSVTVPATLQSPIINARLLVVKTRISLLNQETKKSVPDSTVIENRLLELHRSIRDFILHINEKIEKDRLDQKGIKNAQSVPKP